MNTIDAPTTNISRFLDRSIRPIFNDKVKEHIIIDGADLITKLHEHANCGHLKPNTLFCTFDINNLYTMLPQQESLNILVNFLQTFDRKSISGMNIDTIRALAQMVIEENVFVYRNKYYQQIIGGAMGSPFTLTLANIFMWKWQTECMTGKLSDSEFYGRYFADQIWNS